MGGLESRASRVTESESRAFRVAESARPDRRPRVRDATALWTGGAGAGAAGRRCTITRGGAGAGPAATRCVCTPAPRTSLQCSTGAAGDWGGAGATAGAGAGVFAIWPSAGGRGVGPDAGVGAGAIFFFLVFFFFGGHLFLRSATQNLCANRPVSRVQTHFSPKFSATTPPCWPS